MKKLSASALPGFLFKSVLVLAAIAGAGVLGVGIAGAIAYHELVGRFDGARSVHASAPAEPTVTPRTVSVTSLDIWQGQKIAMNVEASLAANRFVAAEDSDKPQFTYADNRSDDMPAPRGQVRSAATATAVPPPLEPTAEDAAPVSRKDVARLMDPGSRYIVDENTGRVIGIDGTAGATEEARQQAPVAPRPERTVRAALPVDSLSSDLPPPKPELYPAVRRAMPVVDEATPEQPQGFNASVEVADDNTPVLRAQAVTMTPPVRRPQRLFSLP